MKETKINMIHFQELCFLAQTQGPFAFCCHPLQPFTVVCLHVFVLPTDITNTTLCQVPSATTLGQDSLESVPLLSCLSSSPVFSDWLFVMLQPAWSFSSCPTSILGDSAFFYPFLFSTWYFYGLFGSFTYFMLITFTSRSSQACHPTLVLPPQKKTLKTSSICVVTRAHSQSPGVQPLKENWVFSADPGPH